MGTFGELFEKLIHSGSINLIIGGALIAIAIISLIWMYSWFKKTKEYKSILNSIEDKVEACTSEEVLKAIKAEEISKSEKESSDEKSHLDKEITQNERTEATLLEENKPKFNFNRAATAIETLNDEEEKTISQKIVEQKHEEKQRNAKNVKVNIEQPKAATVTPVVEETSVVEETPVVEKIQFDRSDLEEQLREIDKQNNAGTEEKTAETTDDADACEVDVFDEIRKMLIETEKAPKVGVPKMTKEQSDNVARSGKEYTREELEDLIKF